MCVKNAHALKEGENIAQNERHFSLKVIGGGSRLTTMPGDVLEERMKL